MKKLFALITLLATLNGAQAQEIVAHRGYWKDNAQNSIASLQKAQAFGCWGSEFDLHLTADNCVVVNHDREIKKTDIQKSTLEKIRSFTLKNGEPVPTLEEYLEQGKKDENCVLVLELKPHYSLERENLLIDKCLQALKDADLLNPHRAVFISFSYHICKELAKKLPDFTVQYLEGDKAPVEVKADGINGIDYHEWSRSPPTSPNWSGTSSAERSNVLRQESPGERTSPRHQCRCYALYHRGTGPSPLLRQCHPRLFHRGDDASPELV